MSEEKKTFGYDAFSKNRREDSFRKIQNNYKSKVLHEYYVKLSNLDKQKHLTEQQKKDIVEAHRRGGEANIRKAAKLLGIKDEKKLEELNKVDDSSFKEIDEDSFGIEEDDEFDRNINKEAETAKDISDREAFERRLEKQKSQSAGMRALTQALDVGRTESFVSRVPIWVKIFVPIAIIILWLIGGVVSCTFGF